MAHQNSILYPWPPTNVPWPPGGPLGPRLGTPAIDEKDYDKLKSTLISMFSKYSPELFDSLIDKNKICFSKPTVYLHEIRKLGQQLNLNDDFLKIKFLKGLPDNIRPIIVAKENMTLDEMARAADCIMDYEAGKGSSVFSVSGPPRVNYGDVSFSNSRQPIHNSFPQNRGNSNFEPDNVQRRNYSGNFQPRNNSYDSGRNNSYDNVRNSSYDNARQNSYDNVRPNYFSDGIPANVRSFHENQRPRVCRSHIYFGNHARNCKPWCILKSNDLPMQPNSRNASRSSSPVSRLGN